MHYTSYSAIVISRSFFSSYSRLIDSKSNLKKQIQNLNRLLIRSASGSRKRRRWLLKKKLRLLRTYKLSGKKSWKNRRKHTSSRLDNGRKKWTRATSKLIF